MTAATQVPARPYRRFVLPAMHRRFTNAAVLSLGICIVEALWMGGFTSFWQFLGTMIVRSSLLFVSILAIYVLRVANMHYGKRTTLSEAQNVAEYIVSIDAARCLAWYLFSALFFCEVYMWSAPSSADLGIIDPGKVYERPRLNERPIFLRSLFMCLAVGQAFVHVIKDYDEIRLPTKRLDAPLERIASSSRHPFFAPLARLRQELVPLLLRAFQRVFLTTVIAPFAYWLFIRDRAWTWSYWAARLVFTLPKSSSQPPVLPPGLPGLAARFLVEGFLLAFAWEVATQAFDMFLAQEPMKQGRLLTDESLDPNGSLISGLMTKRSIPRTFAFWELGLIALHFPARRDLIYKDIDRPGGSTWSNILTVCLGEVHAVVKRIQDDGAAPASAQAPSAGQSSTAPLPSLPHLGSGVKSDNIFTPSKAVPYSQFRGQSPSNKFVEASTTRLIEYAAHQSHASKTLSKGTLDSLYQQAALSVLKSPFGMPFRQTLVRRATVVIIGSPHDSLSLILDAITSIARLVVQSKKEDKLGRVHLDVPSIIRTFTKSHAAIESFMRTLPVHWTDVHFRDADRDVRDVQLILRALRGALRDIVNEFGEFSDSLGLSPSELRLAKETVAKGGGGGEEMRKVTA